MRFSLITALSLAAIWMIVPALSGASGIEVATAQQEVVIFDNGNIYTVYNQPTAPTTFRLSKAMVITKIVDYHWNSARGARPGTIGLQSSTGRSYGPWGTVGSPGQGGVPNAYWTATISQLLQPGDYTVIDSDPQSWARTNGSGGRGHVRVIGYPATGPTPTPARTPTPVGTPLAGFKATAVTEDRSNRNVLIWVEGKGPQTPLDVLNYHLEPGWKGTLSVSIPASGKLTFVAGYGAAGPTGQYDQRITSCVWSGDPRDNTKLPYIVFEANGTLTCSTINKK